ncbi:AAA family ATPase [Pseudomonas benzenivorans]|uniref:AAA family ATPase n=2 Tax=Pseudomonas benzenivorans TaxID=556533 RepID=A0ABY5HF38_9PSED|nr:AAA family ATPase [Pseudomonas benzenivorans]
MRAIFNGENIDYINTRGSISEDLYNGIQLENKMPYEVLRSSFDASNTTKHSSIAGDQKKSTKIFHNNLMTYFPSYRFEKPGYINAPYETKLSFRKDHAYTGHMINPLEVVSGLEPFSNWLMDIVLDMQYQQSNVHLLKANIDRIITLVLGGKERKKLRFGIGPRGFGQTRIQILDTVTNETVYPTIFNLSAGEAGALCMFGELIRQSDNLNNDTVISNSTGVVLIDEIDKHLHIKLQKEVLPFLFSIFPNVQFLISSHSPFLSMGLAESQRDRSKIIDLDNFGVTHDPTTNALYTEVYDMMVSDNQRFRDEYITLKSELNKNTKPLIITEGKTDIQHIRKSQKALGIDLDAEYFSVPGDWGDSKLKLLLEQLSKVSQRRVIIGIFDRDVPSVVDLIEKNGKVFKDFGNNVFGMCLPTPTGREKYKNISIEFFYSDTDLLKEKDGKRLHFDNEIRFFQPGNKQGKPKPEKLDKADPAGEDTKKIFDSDIGELEGAHSKSRFADLIENDDEFGCGINYDEFKGIFERISMILDTSKP